MQTGSTTVDDDGPQRLGLVASALAGRTVAVAAVDPGEPAWTDGITIFVDAAESAAQAARVGDRAGVAAGGGSLDARRRAQAASAARSGQEVSGHRGSPRARGERGSAAVSGAVADRLRPRHARRFVRRVTGRWPATDKVADPPAQLRCDPGAQPAGRAPEASQQSDTATVSTFLDASRTRSWPNSTTTRSTTPTPTDLFTSPVGGGGVIGKLLKSMLRRVRQLSGGGPPGRGFADASAHKRNSRRRGGDVDRRWLAARTPRTPKRRRRQEVPGMGRAPQALPARLVHRARGRAAARRTATRWRGPMSTRCGGRWPDSAWACTAATGRRRATTSTSTPPSKPASRCMAGSVPDEAVYLDSLRRRRDLSVLVLLDVSGSVGRGGHPRPDRARAATRGGRRPHRRAARPRRSRRAVRLPLAGPLRGAHGARQALRRSPRRAGDAAAQQPRTRRVLAARRGHPARLGGVLEERGARRGDCWSCCPTGWPTTTATSGPTAPPTRAGRSTEARRRGTGCVCLTVGAGTDVGELRGCSAAPRTPSIPQPDQLAGVIGPLFRSALRSADVRRRVS